MTMKMTNCRGCKAPIYWATKFQKRHPFNPNGSSHFDSCPKATNFRGRTHIPQPEYNDESRQEQKDAWIKRNRCNYPTALDWDIAEIHPIPEKHFIAVLGELESPGSLYQDGVAYPDLHITDCIVQGEYIYAVIVSHILYNELYHYLYYFDELLYKQCGIKKYMFVTTKSVPKEKWNAYIRQQDEKYILSLPKERLAKLYFPEQQGES